MRQRAYWMFIALFAVLLAATAAAKSSTNPGGATETPDPWAQQDPWIARMRNSLLRGSPVPFKDFDDIFSDQFFSRQGDPFALFGQSWSGWFDDGMDLSAIRERTRETDKEVIVELKIAGLDKESLDINVDDSRIRLAYDARKLEDKKDGDGREVFKSESVQHFEKIIPIPQDADPRKSRIAREGDVVKIVFPKKQGAVNADA